TVLHEYELTPKGLAETISWLRGRSLPELQALSGASAERLRLVPVAALVLREVLRVFKPKRVAMSGYGIREGLLYEQMPPEMRRRDPLIEACRQMEAAQARLPGFGERLHEFLLPVFKGQSAERLRLIRAACLLHDVTWRAHPDYRAQVCFDNATRANLGGLDHRGRVFLGIALLHRYKNARPRSFEPVAALLTPRELGLAETVGKAMRFGAMLSASTPEMMGRLRYRPKIGELELILDTHSQDLFGEVVLARFEAFAKALGARGRVRVAA
ncbi:MAG: exopolyphosphatase, partial [Rhodobacteraceae bacterium]|nr:exopolyphosphatase [Paracoccaceae bacterium]